MRPRFSFPKKLLPREARMYRGRRKLYMRAIEQRIEAYHFSVREKIEQGWGGRNLLLGRYDTNGLGLTLQMFSAKPSSAVCTAPAALLN